MVGRHKIEISPLEEILTTLFYYLTAIMSTRPEKALKYAKIQSYNIFLKLQWKYPLTAEL